MFVDHAVFYDILSLKVSKTIEIMGLLSPPNRPFLLHRPQGGGTAHFGKHWCKLSMQKINRHATQTTHLNWAAHKQ